jgi:hypothetical protein
MSILLFWDSKGYLVIKMNKMINLYIFGYFIYFFFFTCEVKDVNCYLTCKP